MQGSARDVTNETDDAGEQRLRTVSQADAAREVFGRDEHGGAVGGPGRGDRAVLPEGEQSWGSSAGRVGADAAPSLPAIVVRPVGPGGGGSAVRLAGDARVCGYRSWARAGAGRNDGDAV